MTMLLKYFDLSPRWPTLRNDPNVIAQMADLTFAVSEDPKGTERVFVVIRNGKIISGVSHSDSGYPREEDNQREYRNAAYTAISYAASYLMSTTLLFAERAVVIGNLVALYSKVNALEKYKDDRVTQRLIDDPRKATNPSDCQLDALAMLSEIWHVFPTFDNTGLATQYENVKLNVVTLWGIEKFRYKLTAKGGTYELTAYVDVGFEENVEEKVNNFMADFEIPLQSIPVDTPDIEGEDE